jgi:hypothetical protein
MLFSSPHIDLELRDKYWFEILTIDIGPDEFVMPEQGGGVTEVLLSVSACS